MKKKIISAIISLIICLTSFSLGVFAEEEPYWEKNAVIDGSTLTLTITLRGAKKVAGGSVRIDYDATCLEYVCPEIDGSNCEVRDEDWLGVQRGNINGHTKPGMFISNFFSARAQEPGAILCEVEFKIKDGKTVGQLTLTEDLLADTLGNVTGKPTPINIICKHEYEDYLNGDKYCEYCGSEEGETEGEQLAASGHMHDFVADSALSTPATCQTTGKTVEVCTTCGKKRESTADIIDHNYVETPGEEGAPTCTDRGVKVLACTMCGAKTESKAYALGHDFHEDTSLKKEPSTTEKGQRGYGCTRCSEVVVIELPKL